MEKFLSQSVNKIDAKSRVSVPAHFRNILAAVSSKELYALRALDVPALNVGGPDLLLAYEKKLAELDPFSQEADDLSFFLHGDGMFLKLDSDGRIMVTEAMRAHAGLTDHVAFVGRGRFFQIWHPEALTEYSAQVRSRLLKTRQNGAAAL